MILNKKQLGEIIFWVGYPVIFFLLRNSHRSRVIILAEDKVLFVRKLLGDKDLSLPGGGLKKGENSNQATVREVKEETGLDINPKSLELVKESIVLRERGIKYFSDCYQTTLKKVVNTSTKKVEIIESIWLPYREVLDTDQLSKNTNKLLHAWLEKRHLVD